MPAWPAAAPRAGPTGRVVGGGPPHRNVEGVVAFLIVGAIPELGGELRGALQRQPGLGQDVGAAEVHRTAALVAVAGGQQGRGQLHDSSDVVAGSRLMLGSPYPQRGHIPPEQELLLQRELVVVPAALLGGPGQYVVDTRRVPAAPTPC